MKRRRKKSNQTLFNIIGLLVIISMVIGGLSLAIIPPSGSTPTPFPTLPSSATPSTIAPPTVTLTPSETPLPAGPPSLTPATPAAPTVTATATVTPTATATSIANPAATPIHLTSKDAERFWNNTRDSNGKSNQTIRQLYSCKRSQSARATGPGLWVPRPQRRRQDDDYSHVAWHPAPYQWKCPSL